MITRRRQAAAANQRGFLLMTTMALLLFFTLTTVALLSMTITLMRVTQRHAEVADAVRSADGAMDIAINQLRMDQDGPTKICAGGTANADGSYNITDSRLTNLPVPMTVTCTATNTSTQRVITLKAAKSGGVAKGRASLKIVDDPSPGANLVVCDWQLGGTVTATPASCP
ncbi:hypothetical protein BH10ACT3_BH10ACT3_19770 [soil metagenome]